MGAPANARARNWVTFLNGKPVEIIRGDANNNPDRIQYDRASDTKGNTKAEQNAQYQKGVSDKAMEVYKSTFRGKTRTWFYDTFGF